MKCQGPRPCEVALPLRSRRYEPAKSIQSARMAGAHGCVPLVLLVVLLSNCSARIVRHGTAVPAPVDRTLHIRSIPAVNGYNSQIYEVLMTPYLPKVWILQN